MEARTQDSGVFIRRDVTDDLNVVVVERPGFQELFITAYPRPDRPPFDFFKSLVKRLRREDALVVGQSVFGAYSQHDEGMRSLRGHNHGVNWPTTWLEGDGGEWAPIAGTQVFAISSCTPQRIRIDGRIVGVVYEGADARHCLLGDLRPCDAGLSREMQAREIYKTISTALHLVGMNVTDLIHTRMFLSDIATWYDAFVQARHSAIQEIGLVDCRLPVSTDVGALNLGGVAVVGDALAIQPKNGRCDIRAVPHLVVTPGLPQGESATRALEATFPGLRRLWVSGMASTDPAGVTVHGGVARDQIAYVMKGMHAVLASRGFGWHDVLRAVIYLNRMADVALFEEVCREQDVPRMPHLAVHGELFRKELLFEMEIEAATATIA